MELKLKNGDYVPDGAGGFARLNGDEALLSQALWRLQARRGGFALLPELGSRLHLLSAEKPSARAACARQYAQEALEALGLRVEAAAVTPRADGLFDIRLQLQYDGGSASVEVTA